MCVGALSLYSPGNHWRIVKQKKRVRRKRESKWKAHGGVNILLERAHYQGHSLYHAVRKRKRGGDMRDWGERECMYTLLKGDGSINYPPASLKEVYSFVIVRVCANANSGAVPNPPTFTNAITRFSFLLSFSWVFVAHPTNRCV